MFREMENLFIVVWWSGAIVRNCYKNVRYYIFIRNPSWVARKKNHILLWFFKLVLWAENIRISSDLSTLIDKLELSGRNYNGPN